MIHAAPPGLKAARGRSVFRMVVRMQPKIRAANGTVALDKVARKAWAPMEGPKLRKRK